MKNKNLDNRILNLLGKNPSYPSQVAKNLGVLRTSINYHLMKLEKNKLIEKKKSGKKTIYSIIPNKKGNKNLYKLYTGKEELVQAYYQLFKLPKNSIILVIQGSESAKDELSNLPDNVIKEFHKTIKRKNIIMKGISNKNILKHLEGMRKDMMVSHIGRTQSFRMVSDNKFLSSSEIFSTNKFILLSNPKNRKALIIKDKEITKLTNDTLTLMFEFMENYKTFDINNYLKNKIITI